MAINSTDIDRILDRTSLKYLNEIGGEGFRFHAHSAVLSTLSLLGVSITYVEPEPEAPDTSPAPVDSTDAGLSRIFARKRTFRTAVYICQNPGCRDPLTKLGTRSKLRFFLEEPIPAWMLCWKCKAGRGMTMQDQEQRKVGMLAQVQSMKFVTEDGEGNEVEETDEGADHTEKGDQGVRPGPSQGQPAPPNVRHPGRR